jgi:hypothetical protein
MHTEQPGCVSRGPRALGEHFDNFWLRTPRSLDFFVEMILARNRL